MRYKAVGMPPGTNVQWIRHSRAIQHRALLDSAEYGMHSYNAEPELLLHMPKSKVFSTLNFRKQVFWSHHIIRLWILAVHCIVIALCYRYVYMYIYLSIYQQGSTSIWTMPILNFTLAIKTLRFSSGTHSLCDMRSARLVSVICI